MIKLQSMMWYLPRKISGLLGIDLERTYTGARVFSYRRIPRSQEDRSYWGLLGFALVWPAVALLLLGAWRSQRGRLLSAAAVLFPLALSYLGMHSEWRGHYFVVGAVFAAPVAAWAYHRLRSGRLTRAWVASAALYGGLRAAPTRGSPPQARRPPTGTGGWERGVAAHTIPFLPPFPNRSQGKPLGHRSVF